MYQISPNTIRLRIVTTDRVNAVTKLRVYVNYVHKAECLVHDNIQRESNQRCGPAT